MNLQMIKSHINEIKNFCSYTKHRLSKLKDIKRDNFILYLKECKFRHNIKRQ